MNMFAGSLRTLRASAAVLENQKIKWATVRRTLGVAAPHSGMLLAFLVVVIVSSSIGITYPLIYRAIINQGILRENASLIIRLAVLIAVLGMFDAALGVCQTYLATRVGAEVVVSMRTRLFDHIQRMPLAFFSRTQTGALVNRLVTDASGARSAFTDVLSNLGGNSRNREFTQICTDGSSQLQHRESTDLHTEVLPIPRRRPYPIEFKTP